MKGYYVTKEFFEKLFLCIGGIAVLGVLVLFDKSNVMPPLVYWICIAFVGIYLVLTIVAFFGNKQQFLSKLYLYDDHFEIRYKEKVLDSIKLEHILEIAQETVGIKMFIAIKYQSKGKTKQTLFEGNKTIAEYFSKVEIKSKEDKKVEE